jgi:hypothetical protein
MTESNKTRTGMNIFYVWIQKKLPNKIYHIYEQDTNTMEYLDDAGMMTFEREQAMITYLDDDEEKEITFHVTYSLTQ